MPISKVIYKPSAQATPEVWMDDTTNTNTPARVFSGDTGTAADGSHFSGTYTPPASIEVEELEVTQNGTYTASTGKAYSPVTVNVSGGGGSSVEAKAVNFIDYDGTIVYSYTAQEAAALTELPDNPSHEGLTAQGWNWSLTNIKTQLTSMPNAPVWIGQSYITQSGDTEIDIVLYDGRTSPYLGIAVNGTVTVDWGDNSTSDTVTGTSTSTQIRTKHDYATSGEYTISIHVESGSFAFYGTSAYFILNNNSSGAGYNRVYSNAVKAVRIGGGVSIGQYAFYYCSSLKTVTIPRSILYVGGYAFEYCESLQSITIPNTFTSYSFGSYAFAYCRKMAIVSLPDSLLDIGDHVFYQCYALTCVGLPYGLTVIEQYAFQYNYAQTKLTIPSGVGVLYEHAFSYCQGMAEYHLLRSTPPTLYTTNVFTSIPSDCIIYVPYSADHSILNAYKTSTNWSNYTSYVQEEPQ